MTLTPQDVKNKEFLTVRLREGYDMQEVDQFLDQITKGTLCMREALRAYLSGDDDGFESRLEQVRDYEHRADELRPAVEQLGARAVLNPDYEQGMYTSLRTGVATSRS